MDSHRRQFLKVTAAAGAAVGTRFFAAPHVLSSPSPNSRLRTVVIGSFNQGKASVSAAVAEDLVGLVDVDDKNLGRAMKFIGEISPETDLSRVKTFYDYRQMFDKLHKQVDAVFIAVPDHHHAVAAMIAMSLGKGVYLEKPMAHSIDEVRRLTAAAEKYKVVTQLGNQGHSSEDIRRLCEYIRAGAIGNVTETYSWAPTGRGGVGGRPPTKPVPEGLHWEQWIGPAHYRDYHKDLHPGAWRSWWEFGNGSVGDWGCHNLDGPFWALNLGAPTSIECIQQVGGSDERYPLLNGVRWNFPARGDMPPVKVHWFDGYLEDAACGGKSKKSDAEKTLNCPPLALELQKKYGRHLSGGGVIFVGHKGVMVADNYCKSPRILPEEQFRKTPVPPKTLPRVKEKTHQADFSAPARTGTSRVRTSAIPVG